jgi:hypothetical protein
LCVRTNPLAGIHTAGLRFAAALIERPRKHFNVLRPPSLMNWISIGMSKQPSGREEFDPATADEEQSYLYQWGPDDAGPELVVDWRQVYWDYYFRAQETGETPVAESATLRYVLYCARCERFSAHVVPLGQAVVEVVCPACLDVFSC